MKREEPGGGAPRHRAPADPREAENRWGDPIDLTRVLAPGMPVYPGDPPVRFLDHSQIEEGGFRVTRLELGTHTGTHVDAPAHVDRAGLGIERVPLAALVGAARVIDVSGRGPGALITPADLEGRIPRGGRVLLRTDWDRQWGRPGYYQKFPALTAEAAELLVEAGTRLLGLESPSVHPAIELAIHQRLLNSDIMIVEGLVGLRRLPEDVWLVVAPLPLQGLDGSPCRVLAFPGASPCDDSDRRAGPPPSR
jgi:kynurenine formamidase